MVDRCLVCRLEERFCVDDSHHVTCGSCGKVMEDAPAIVQAHAEDCGAGEAGVQARNLLYASQAMLRDAPDMHADSLRRSAIGTEELPRMMIEVAFLPLYTIGSTPAFLLDQRFGAHTFPMIQAFFSAMGEAAQVDLLSLQAAVRPSLPEISPSRRAEEGRQRVGRQERWAGRKDRQAATGKQRRKK